MNVGDFGKDDFAGAVSQECEDWGVQGLGCAQASGTTLRWQGLMQKVNDKRKVRGYLKPVDPTVSAACLEQPDPKCLGTTREANIPSPPRPGRTQCS